MKVREFAFVLIEGKLGFANTIVLANGSCFLAISLWNWIYGCNPKQQDRTATPSELCSSASLHLCLGVFFGVLASYFLNSLFFYFTEQSPSCLLAQISIV